MVFNSFAFLVFFMLVIAIYFVLPRKGRAVWLLITSYIFYMGWNAKYVVFLLLSTISTYLAALTIEKWRNQDKRVKAVLGVCIVFNLGILFLFKYLDFALESMTKLFGMVVQPPDFVAGLILPLGISFYTFQVIGYMVDVYRGQVQAERNVLFYALYVSYFPRLVQGPIERSSNLLVQIRNLHEFNIYNCANINRIFFLSPNTEISYSSFYSNVTIYGYQNSTAIEYAQKYHINYNYIIPDNPNINYDKYVT